jgi:hypothetical protein
VKRYVVLALAAVVAAVTLVVVGRWERDRRADAEVRGMQTVVEAVGPLDSKSLKGFRLFGEFDCLVYKRGRLPYALELCVDARGRLVEAIDRRSGDPRIWSLRDDPTRSTISVDRDEVDRLLLRMGVPRRILLTEEGRS